MRKRFGGSKKKKIKLRIVKKQKNNTIKKSSNKSKKKKKTKRKLKIIRSFNNWVSNFFKDTGYKIVETISQGDCFFDSVRLGLKTEDEKITIKQLRQFLVDNINESQLDTFKNLYLGARLMQDQGLINEFRFMSGVETLSDLKKKLKHPNFWANSWAIGIIESSLNIKVLILSEEAYLRGDLNNVIQCGDMSISDAEPVCEICGLTKYDFDLKIGLRESEKIHAQKGIKDHKWVEMESTKTYNPRGYVIVTYSGNHYRLITHKDKGFFKSINQLPFNIVQAFYNKCVKEQNFKGAYALINDFKNL
jgi:hypothetical protein